MSTGASCSANEYFRTSASVRLGTDSAYAQVGFVIKANRYAIPSRITSLVCIASVLHNGMTVLHAANALVKSSRILAASMIECKILKNPGNFGEFWENFSHCMHPRSTRQTGSSPQCIHTENSIQVHHMRLNLVVHLDTHIFN